MDKILNLLNQLENKLICHLCHKKCTDPVRLITCDHYFCEVCLKKSKNPHACPHCKAYYELSDIEHDNMVRRSEQQLKRLRQILEENDLMQERPSENLPTSLLYTQEKPKVKPLKNIEEIFEANCKDFLIIIKNRTYHINFIPSLIGKVNPKGETQLHLACKRKKMEIVKKLIEEKSVDINIKDHAGWAPLHEAVQSQSLEITEILLKSGCLIDIPGLDYVTPLHQAASLGNFEIVKLLLRYGADKNVVDYNGLKPIDSTKNQAIKDVLNDKNLTQDQNLKFELFLPKKLTMYCHSIDHEYKTKLRSNKDITVEDKIENKKKPTHIVIKKTHKISFKILQSMLMGIQFLTQQSIDDFIQGNYFIPIPNYVFISDNKDLNEGIKKSMISSLLKLPSLFAGLNFFIEHHNSPVNIHNLKVDKEYLTKLIIFGEGRVLHRPPALRICEAEFVHPYFAKSDSGVYRCCNFIIYEETKAPDLKYNMPELKHKSSKWLIDCIIKYEILDNTV